LKIFLEQGAEENIWNYEALAREWRRLLSEELHNLYASPNIIRAIKSRKMRWMGRRGEKERIQTLREENS
jgi:hypothetical protein